jgi:hypothetical protein
MNLTGPCCSPTDQWSQGLSELRVEEKKEPQLGERPRTPSYRPLRILACEFCDVLDFGVFDSWPVLRCAVLRWPLRALEEKHQAWRLHLDKGNRYRLPLYMTRRANRRLSRNSCCQAIGNPPREAARLD